MNQVYVLTDHSYSLECYRWASAQVGERSWTSYRRVPVISRPDTVVQARNQICADGIDGRIDILEFFDRDS